LACCCGREERRWRKSGVSAGRRGSGFRERETHLDGLGLFRRLLRVRRARAALARGRRRLVGLRRVREDGDGAGRREGRAGATLLDAAAPSADPLELLVRVRLRRLAEERVGVSVTGQVLPLLALVAADHLLAVVLRACKRG